MQGGACRGNDAHAPQHIRSGLSYCAVRVAASCAWSAERQPKCRGPKQVAWAHSMLGWWGLHDSTGDGHSTLEVTVPVVRLPYLFFSCWGVSVWSVATSRGPLTQRGMLLDGL